MRSLYFDHAATTPCRPEVWAAMEPYFLTEFANASSIHRGGRSARRALEEARATVASGFGCHESEVVFTSGASESSTLAIRGSAMASRDRGRHIVTTRIEHAALLDNCRVLEAEGFEVDYVDVDPSGRVSPEEVALAVRDDTLMVCLAHANSEIGTVQPVGEISRSVKARNGRTLVYVDAVQTAGHLEIDVGEWGADLVGFTAHKFYGPKGIGGLFVKEGVQLRPQIAGGGQERGYRSGTESVALAVGMAEAIRLSAQEMTAEQQHWIPIRDRLIAGLLREIPDSRLNGHPRERLPTNVNVSFLGTDGEDLVLRLDRMGFQLSTGSACSTGRVEPSHVLTALGVPRTWALGTIRFSFGSACRGVEVGELVANTRRAVAELRSTHYTPRPKPAPALAGW
jgi:cysteine desulfurase